MPGKSGGKEGEIPLVRLPTMVFPVLKQNVVGRYLTINIELHLSDMDARARLAELQPKMVETIFARLYGKVSDDTTEVDIQKLVTAVSQTMIGDNKVASVSVELK